MDAQAIPGAICPLHVDQAIAFACARCGAFGCESCRATSPGICVQCEARMRAASDVAVAPAFREGVSLALAQLPQLGVVLVLEAMANLGIEVVKQHFQPNVPDFQHAGANLASAASALGVISVFNLPGMVAESVIGTASDGVQILSFESRIRGAPMKLTALLPRMLARYPAMLAVSLFSTIAGSEGLFMCCIPGILLDAVTTFSEQEALLATRGPFSAIRASFQLARPRFFRLVLVAAAYLLVSFLFTRLIETGLEALPMATAARTLAQRGLIRAVGVLSSCYMTASLTVLWLRLREVAPR